MKKSENMQVWIKKVGFGSAQLLTLGCGLRKVQQCCTPPGKEKSVINMI
jgi:hypothetical protein